MTYMIFDRDRYSMKWPKLMSLLITNSRTSLKIFSPRLFYSLIVVLLSNMVELPSDCVAPLSEERYDIDTTDLSIDL